MASSAARSAIVRLIFVTLCFVTTYAKVEALERQRPQVDELPAACMAAEDDFRPLTEADLQEAKAELVQALARLDRRLDADTENGPGWRKYVRWDRLQKQIRRDQAPELTVLSGVYSKYAAGHEGLRLACFLEVGQALRQYLIVARARDNPELQTDYGRVLDQLDSLLRACGPTPTAEQALAIGEAIRWLQAARQAPQLVRAIRHRFVHPNLLLTVSGDLFAAGIAGPVDETTPVREVILGTDVYGTGHTTGRISVELFPDAGRGVFDTILRGTTRTTNIGYHGPVQIYSSGTTRITARKRFQIDQTGLSSLPAACRATTKTKITDVRTRRGCRHIERMAWKRVFRQQAEAECIASRRAEQRVIDRVNQQAAEMIDRANTAFLGKFRKPLRERNLFPQQLRFSTAQKALDVAALQADTAQLAAPSAPPPLEEQPDMAIRVHESMVNNLAASALAGMRLRQETFQAAVVELLGKLPERMEAEEDREPWTIVFAREKPIWATFANDGVRITIRGQKYYKGEESYPGMDVTAEYKIAKAEQGFKAVRQGDLQIFPPGFVPGSQERLSPRQVVIQTLLKRRFGRIFEEELVLENLDLPGKWKKAGTMEPVELASKQGWLTLVWKRAPDDPPSPGDE